MKFTVSSYRLACHLITFISIGLIGSCSNPDTGHWVGDYLTATDFESLRGWAPGLDASALTRDHAHSGQYATFVGPEREFSLTYDMPLNEASLHTLKGIVVEGWVYLSKPQSAASLDVQVRLPGESNLVGFSERLMLPDQVQKGAEWTSVRKEFIFPAGLPGDAHLRVFLWRNSSHEPVYLDDLKIKALE